MTFKKSQRGVWFFKSFRYELLMVDKKEFFVLTSKKELTASDLDTLFLKIMNLAVTSGKLKTEKGMIKFKTSNLNWLKEDEFKNSKEVTQGSEEKS